MGNLRMLLNISIHHFKNTREMEGVRQPFQELQSFVQTTGTGSKVLYRLHVNWSKTLNCILMDFKWLW